MIAGWTEAELLEEVVDAPTRTIVGLPDTVIIDRPGWRQVITPSLKQGGLNDVSLAVLAEGEVEAAIDRVLATYAEHGASFRWFVAPGSAPADLGERLAARGLARSEVVAMARPIGAVDDDLQEVEHVDAEGPALEAFTDVMARGWDADPAVLHQLHRALLAAGHHRLFLARAHGEPAGAGAYLTASGRSAYLMGAVVLPAFRGRGLYRALVEARVADAAARGMTLATSQANAATSAPILARLGFIEVARFACYRT